ncbi:GreA/GreB family elongation factor [Herminiimonas sp. NPDC097707]|uniref:GreA/GreB family elongation factor n=1 Tax=Herminiimonas sp. NPDC097707 TaxID=3364007 RepID=UPI00383BB658
MKNQRYLTQNDASILSKLAEHLLRLGEVEINAGEELIDIISTSVILPINAPRKDCVSLYSTVSYSPYNSDEKRSITIVCPQDANPQLALISTLTPIGLALIGRKISSTVEVELPSNRVEKIKILDVTPLDSAVGELAHS